MNRNCELCNGKASVYCPSDNAFLCCACDSKVHCANFLVARHVRSFLCSNCSDFDGNRFTGAGVPPLATLSCRNCNPSAALDDDSGNDDGDDGDSLSSSSSCVSSTGEEVETTSFRKRREKACGVDVKRRREKRTVVPDLKVEGVLVNWCKRMGGGMVEERQIGAVVNMAVELLSGCFNRITSLPFRVSLAAAFWVAVRVVCRRGGVHGGGSNAICQDLRRVEQISGVPAKLILATEARFTRVIKRRESRDNHEEGWAEC